MYYGFCCGSEVFCVEYLYSIIKRDGRTRTHTHTRAHTRDCHKERLLLCIYCAGMHKHNNFTLSQMTNDRCEASAEKASEQTKSSDDSRFAIRSSVVRERCGYCPPNPMLGAQEAEEAAKRWVKRAQQASEEGTAVKSFENAIAMYYLADFVHNDEPNGTPATLHVR